MRLTERLTKERAKRRNAEMYLRLEREAARQNFERAQRAEAILAAAWKAAINEGHGEQARLLKTVAILSGQVEL